MLYLIGVSLYRRRVALTGSESGSTHLPHIPKRTTCFFFFLWIESFFLRGFTFFSDSMTENKKKDRKGKKKGNKKGQKEKEGEPTAGKRKLIVSV